MTLPVKFLLVFGSIAAWNQAFSLTVYQSGASDYFSALHSTCDELATEIRALKEWKKRADNQTCKTPELNQKDDYCQALVTDCLPEQVQKYSSKKANVDGPNCWNLALVLGGLIPHLRYSKPEEFGFFLQEPICRQLRNDEARQPGDIGAMRTSNGKEIHGFIHISENTVFTKNGFDQRVPYKLTSKVAMLEVYEDHKQIKLTKECHQNTVVNKENCRMYTEYFRCDSMEQFLKKNEPKIGNDIQELNQTINQVDCYVNSMTVNLGDTRFPINLLVIQNLKILTAYFNSQIDKISSMSEEEQFLLTSMKLRLISISKAMTFVSDENRWLEETSELSGLNEMINTSLEKIEVKSKEE